MDFPVIDELELPSSVKTLNYRVLANCTGLTKLVVPASVTSINENAFDFTTGVTLHVYSGSYALDWAKSHSVSYYLIDPPAGDSNRDGVVDSSELERILMHILGLSLISQPDGNRDVSIDIRDFNLAYYEMTRGWIKTCMAKSCAGRSLYSLPQLHRQVRDCLPLGGPEGYPSATSRSIIREKPRTIPIVPR